MVFGPTLTPLDFGGGFVDPTSYTGLIVWLKPETITGFNDGDQITSTWEDQSGTGNDASPLGTTKPKFSAASNYYHGLPMVHISANDSRMQITGNATLENTARTCFHVVDLNDQGGTILHVAEKRTGNGPDNFNIRITNGVTAIYIKRDGDTAVDVGGPAFHEDGPVVIAWRYNGTTLDLWLNKYKFSTSAAGTFPVDTSGYDPLTIGNRFSGTNYSRCMHGDFILYNHGDLTDNQVETVIEYLQGRWKASAWQFVEQTFTDDAVQNPSFFYDSDNSQYVMVYNHPNGTANYKTSPESDPHNWTDQGGLGFSTCRGTALHKEGSTYYLFYDNFSTGVINLATGTSLGSLSAHGSNPIISGTGTPADTNEFVRAPSVVREGDNLHVIVDGRANSAASGVGAIWKYSTTWARFAADPTDFDAPTEILTPVVGSNWEEDDVTHPDVVKIGSTYYMAYGGYNDNHWDPQAQFPHQLGMAKSTDLTTWTRMNNGNTLMVRFGDGSTRFDATQQTGPGILVIDSVPHLYFSGEDADNFNTARAALRSGVSIGDL